MRTRGIAAELIAEKMREVFAQKGYAFFDGGKPYNVNVIGVRSPSDEANTFDDFILTIYRDDDLTMIVDSYLATTHPGKKYMRRPINVKGSAILVPGQYRGAYKIGKHRGQYDALCQLGGPVKVWRDDNRDEVLDHAGGDLEVDDGWHGINLHRAHPVRQLEKVNGYSAGCQVWASPTDFSEFMNICKRSAMMYGERFTYTLVDWSDLASVDRPFPVV